ncbi:MAG TPA: fimbrial protein [Buttiauxella sp.]|jgi:major type 1 subunit fimbrin (pilin)
MKKSRVFVLGLMSVLCAGTLNAQAADTGTITFNGNITDNTCTVSVDGQGADGTVTLPDVPVTALKESQSNAGKTPFSLKVSGCSDNGQTVTSEFKADAMKDLNIMDAGSGSYGLVNKASEGAENVVLQILDNDRVLNIGFVNDAGLETGSGEQYGTYMSFSNDGTAELPFAVQYHSTLNGTVTAGPVEATVNYILAYK